MVIFTVVYMDIVSNTTVSVLQIGINDLQLNQGSCWRRYQPGTKHVSEVNTQYTIKVHGRNRTQSFLFCKTPLQIFVLLVCLSLAMLTLLQMGGKRLKRIMTSLSCISPFFKPQLIFYTHKDSFKQKLDILGIFFSIFIT